jgi:hypothetical protein
MKSRNENGTIIDLDFIHYLFTKWNESYKNTGKIDDKYILNCVYPI